MTLLIVLEMQKDYLTIIYRPLHTQKFVEEGMPLQNSADVFQIVTSLPMFG